MGIEDWIDTVVLDEEARIAETAPDPQSDALTNVPLVNDVRLTRVGGAEVDLLTIDESMDVGGDPYNSTGKHCILRRGKE
jgi:hypothetical protein